MLQLFDLNYNKIHGLTNYKDLKRERTLDGEEILSFLYPQSDSKNKSIQEEAYIRTKDNEYVVKEVNIDDDWTEFVAKINVEGLKGNVIESFESVEQTITDCLDLALVSTGWTIGSCDVTKKRTVRMSRKSTYNIIQEARKIYRCDYKFEAINKKIYIYQSMGADKGSYFTEELNLKKLSVQSNSYDFCTRIIPIGKNGLQINGINGGKQYVENYQYSSKVITVYWEDNRYTVVESLKEDAIARLNELSKPVKSYRAEMFDLARLNDKYKNILDYDLGDTITLLSKDKKVKDKQRIVKIIEYPEESERNTCEIANRIMSLEDLQVDFEVAADTVDTITNSDGGLDGSKIDSIEWTQVKHVSIYTADIQDMNVITGRIGTLETTTAHITNGVIDNATIDAAKVNNLSSTYATITNLNAVNANLQTVTGDVAIIKNVLAGNVGANNLAAGAIQAGSAVIAAGAIGSAQISDLDVSKLNAGDISTSKFRIVSSGGNMLIFDNTIQIKDASRVRVQIGKDASNDYNMYVWDSSGNLMFDATGLKASGIKSKIIVDSMVSDTANINGSKIEKESLIVQINGATTTLKSSRVKLDTENQTLDFAFTSLKSTVTSHDTTISSQGTSISTIQGQISSKIWSTDISTAVNNIQVGSRNIVLDSSFENGDLTSNWVYATASTWGTSYVYGARDGVVHSSYGSYSCKCGNGTTYGVGIAEKKQGTSAHPVIPGQIYQLGFDVYSTDAATQYIACIRCYDGTGANVSGTVAKSFGWSYSVAYGTFCQYTTIPSANAWNRIVLPFMATAGVSYVAISLMYYVGGDLKYIWFDNIKFEQGTKATDWTQAPEDIDSQITTINTKYSNLTQTVNGISANVGALQTTTSDLSSRMSTAEGSINLLQNQISLKVTQTDIDNSINSMQIGGRNYMQLRNLTSYTPYNSTPTYSGTVITSTYTSASSYFTLAVAGFMPSNTVYTISGYIKKNGAPFAIDRGLASTYASNMTDFQANATTGYFKITQTYSGSSSWIMHKQINGMAFGDVITIDKLKFELGTKATDWTPAPEDIQGDITYAVNDVYTMTKINGQELISQNFKRGIDDTGFTINGTGAYTLVNGILASPNNDQYVIKASNSTYIRSDFIPVDFARPFYISVSAYNDTTTNGMLYVGIEFFDRNKVTLGANDLCIYAISADTTALPLNTWKTFEGYIQTSSIDATRQKAAYIRLRILTRWNGNSGITYIKDLSLKQLGPQVISNTINRLTTAELKITADAIVSTVSSSISSSSLPTLIIDDDDPNITYYGTWSSVTSAGNLNGKTDKESIKAGDYIQYTFIGTGINVYTLKSSSSGIVGISIDGGTATNIDLYNSSTLYKQKTFSVTNLSYGKHTIKITLTGTKNVSSTNYAIGFDYFEVLNSTAVNNSNIVSQINQTAEGITIQANKIGLLGQTNIPDLTADKIKGGTISGVTIDVATDIKVGTTLCLRAGGEANIAGGNIWFGGGSQYHGHIYATAADDGMHPEYGQLHYSAGGGAFTGHYFDGHAQFNNNLSVSGDTYGKDIHSYGWFYSHGNTGWYNSNYGGGWFMEDTSWIKSYNNKWIFTAGIMRADGGFQLNQAQTTIGIGSNTSLRVGTMYGYVDIGPKNADWCHIETDRPNFWFGKDVHINGLLGFYPVGTTIYASSDGSFNFDTNKNLRWQLDYPSQALYKYVSGSWYRLAG